MDESLRDELRARIANNAGIPHLLRTYALLRLKGASQKAIMDELEREDMDFAQVERSAEGQLAGFLSMNDLRLYSHFSSLAKTKRKVKKSATTPTAKSEAPALRMSEEALAALAVLEGTRDHVFLTGRAGTGKSTLLDHFRKSTKKNIVVLAPTGVAALNVSGQTIHSFFGFGLSTSPGGLKKVHAEKAKVFKKLDAIVIDEVSMARADIIDCIDERMRLNGPDASKPFGGVQMIFVGDLFQLPPVVMREEESYFSSHYKSPFFFDARVFAKVKLRMVELERIWRQSNARFIDILDRIRRNDIHEEHLALLNTRHIQGHIPQGGDFVVTLTTTNAAADGVNEKNLADLGGEVFQSKASVAGDFDLKTAPAPADLRVKEGAQVMLLNNDKQGRWVNGDIGIVSRVTSRGFSVRLLRGQEYDISRVSWDIVRYEWMEEEQRVASVPTGSFIQYPVRLAWAVTIHKGQGKTFPKIVVDFGGGTFAPGQAYVALSRCTSLEGIVLRRPFLKNHIKVDPRVVEFTDSLRWSSHSPTKDPL